MNPRRNFGAAASGIVTRAELEARITARAKPVAERHPAPPGWEVGEVRVQVDAANESRIRHIQSRLERASSEARGDLALSKMCGKARVDFGRCD